MAEPSPFLLAQVSDLHIKAKGQLSYRVVDTATMLAACVAHLNALPQRPDAVAFTGDLVDFGRPDEYAELRRLIAPLTMPCYLIPGNHDDRDALRAAFPEHAWLMNGGEFIQYAIEDHPLRIVAMDTVIPGQGGGRLCERRLAWLDATLAARPQAPTILLLHHPPFRTFIGHMDQLGLENADGLAAVVRKHPQVERLLCGHLHRPIEARFAGTIACTAPSPAHQIVLNLAPDAASRFAMEPPGYRLHAWTAETGVISHSAFIGDFAGPFPFHDGGELID